MFRAVAQTRAINSKTTRDHTFTPAPHSGYHRRAPSINDRINDLQSKRFFEGWYFRLTQPEEIGKSVSLIFHVFDPDDSKSSRRGFGAQCVGPNGEYLYRASEDVNRFRAEAHKLEIFSDFGRPSDAMMIPKIDDVEVIDFDDENDEKRKEFFEVSKLGTKHRGYLRAKKDDEERSSTISPWFGSDVKEYVKWDIDVQPLKTYGSGSESDKAVSPAGWLASLPLLEPHYQILFAHAMASGYVEIDGEKTVFSNAPFYAEKNWGGGGFPRKWFWTQCNSFPEYPDLSVVATGANRGVVVSPGTYEDVGMIAIHYGDLFIQFSPVGADKTVKTKSSYVGENTIVKTTTFKWKIHPWGSWEVFATGGSYECIITGSCERDLQKSKTTVLRAPAPDNTTGMLPLCRETFSGDLQVSLYKIDFKTKQRTKTIFENVDAGKTACLEVGGGPWEEPWEISADVKDPLASALAITDINVDFIQGFGALFGLDVVPGL
jgi:tocopherol cyclase